MDLESHNGAEVGLSFFLINLFHHSYAGSALLAQALSSCGKLGL